MRESSKLPALLAIAPFLLAFAPPEEPGTTVSVSAGTGRFVSASGCSRPRLVDVTEQQAAIHHQWAYRGEKAKRFGVGLEGTVAQSREKECTEEDCRNQGWQDNPVASSLSPYGTLDWKWVGLKAGAEFPMHRTDTDSRGQSHPPRILLGYPVRGALRLGYLDRLYVSCEFLDGQPMLGGLAFPVGIGGRFRGTDIWAAPYPDIFEEFGLSARIARQFGPVRLRFSGRWHRDPVNYSSTDFSDGGGPGESFRVAVPEFAAAAGIDYHLPW